MSSHLVMSKRKTWAETTFDLSVPAADSALSIFFRMSAV